MSTEVDTHFSTSLALAASETFLIFAIIETIALKYFCYNFNIFVMLGIAGGIAVLNCLYYMRGRGKRIVEREPLYFGSKWLSIIGTLLFFIVTFSWMFWGPIYGKYLLEQCRGN